jgi:large subunit ribosomal protein LP0
MIRKAMRGRLSQYPGLEKLLPFVTGNIGFVFTNDDLRATREKLLQVRTAAPAKAGGLAPTDVFIESQNTGMGPEKTAFFQALGISTKIAKGTIEISNRVHLIKSGDKVGPSEAALLNMLAISPFTYGLNVRTIYDNGAVFDNEILDISDEQLLGALTIASKNVTSVSLALNRPTIAAVPHLILRAFKETLAVSVESEYTFSYSEKIKEYLKDPSKFAVAAPVATADSGAAAAPKEEEKKAEEPAEESDDDMGFSLFD